MKKNFLFTTLLIAIFFSADAQPQRFKIALFTPLYLDSAFDASGNYTHNRIFPKHLNPGVEFYQGAQLAIDSLQKRGAPLEVFVYDIKSKYNSLSSTLNSADLRDVDMIIAQSSFPETRILAEAAQKKQVPFISATLPNDAGISNNPYMVILNSTLQAHVEGIYKMLQKQHKQQKIIVLRKKGMQEDLLRDHFIEQTKTANGTPVNLSFIDIGMDITPARLARYLDSTKNTVIIAASLDEQFAQKLVQSLNTFKRKYPLTLIGMPNWESINFGKNSSHLDILYTTPHYYTRNTPLERRISDDFATKISSRPSDFYFRGYETMLRFSLLLLDTKQDVASNLTRKGNNVFTSFDIQPVFKDKSSMTLDYFENKNVYFIRMSGGTRSMYYF